MTNSNHNYSNFLGDKDNNLDFEEEMIRDRKLIAKKRNRDKSSSKSTKKLSLNAANNKNASYTGKTFKKNLEKNNFANETEIEEETKDNSNNNEACINYAKNSRNNINNNFYGNDFENIDRINEINYKSLKNKEFSDDENNYYKKNIPNSDFNFHRNNKIENNINPKYSNSPNKKRKKTSTNSLNFCLDIKRNQPDINLEREEINYDSCLNCFLCGWEYPKEMDLKDMNEHVNYCADGEGEKHKKMYASSQRLIKIAINSQEEENLSNKNKSNNKNAENGKEKGNNYCYICSKTIYVRNVKTIDEHILKCYKEKEEEIFTKTQKK